MLPSAEAAVSTLSEASAQVRPIRRDFSPIGYERINKTTGKRVEWDDIVKGYEYARGQYVVLTDDDGVVLGLRDDGGGAHVRGGVRRGRAADDGREGGEGESEESGVERLHGRLLLRAPCQHI